jgi:hypothetical protein
MTHHEHAREYGNKEGSGFAGARLGLGRDVLAAQRLGQGLRLNRGALFKTRGFDPVKDLFRNMKLFKFHGI